MNTLSLEQAEKLNYPLKLSFEDEDEQFVAEFLDLPGCIAYGETAEAAYRNAQEAKAEWLRVTIEQGLPIPKPSTPEEHSGRILVRLPTSLHGMLLDRASLHGASLNQYIVSLLSAGLVEDTVSSQLEEVKDKIAQIEWRLAQLSLHLEPARGQFQQTYGVTTGPSGYVLPCLSQNVGQLAANASELLALRLNTAVSNVVWNPEDIEREAAGPAHRSLRAGRQASQVRQHRG